MPEVDSTLPPFAYLKHINRKPRLEPLYCQENRSNILPSWLARKVQPRGAIGDGSKVVYTNQDRGSKSPANFSVKVKPSPARTILHTRRKNNVTREAPFSCTLATRYGNQDWEEKTRPSFSVNEKPFPARLRFHVNRKTNVTRETLFY